MILNFKKRTQSNSPQKRKNHSFFRGGGENQTQKEVKIVKLEMGFSYITRFPVALTMKVFSLEISLLHSRGRFGAVSRTLRRRDLIIIRLEAPKAEI